MIFFNYVESSSDEIYVTGHLNVQWKNNTKFEIKCPLYWLSMKLNINQVIGYFRNLDQFGQ